MEHLHLTPEYQSGQLAALFVIVGTAGCICSVRRYSDELSKLRSAAERELETSPSTAYWTGYLHAIERVEKELLYGAPEAIVKSIK